MDSIILEYHGILKQFKFYHIKSNHSNEILFCFIIPINWINNTFRS
jgi:hypothetical protein